MRSHQQTGVVRCVDNAFRRLAWAAVLLLAVGLSSGCLSDAEVSPTDVSIADASADDRAQYEFPEAVDGYTTLTFSRRVGFDGVICPGKSWPTTSARSLHSAASSAGPA